MLVGGDFNIIICQEEKNNDNFDARWPFIFNAIIENLDLREIVLWGRQFTWENNLPTPTYEKLDRILTSVELEHKFPLVTIRALQRRVSDHTPLLMDSGAATHVGNKSVFSFELSWFHKEGFFDFVAAEWVKENKGRTHVERW
jgi:hypothetical protein